jgi:hypothetical protein
MGVLITVSGTAILFQSPETMIKIPTENGTIIGYITPPPPNYELPSLMIVGGIILCLCAFAQLVTQRKLRE